MARAAVAINRRAGRHARPGAAQLRLDGVHVPDHEDALAFQIRAYRLPEPVRQLVYGAELGRKFRADFAWPDYRLLVEVQGGIWRKGGGAHSHPTGIVRDIAKQQTAVLAGWAVFPVITDEVTDGSAVQMIVRALHARGWKPDA